MRKINPALLEALAVWTFVFTFGAGPVHGQGKTLTFAMPACPIKARTVPPTKVPFVLPSSNPLGVPFSVMGTVQVTDQNSSPVILTQLVADITNGFNFARTVKALAHATGQLTFDKGCTKTDPFGSNNCHWDFAQNVTAAFQGALQEDIQAGNLSVDLNIDSTIPFQFTCPVCGGSCTFTIPKQVDYGKFSELWVLMSALIQFPLNIIAVPDSITELAYGLDALGLPDGNANSLLAILQAAQSSLNRGNNNAARNQLNAFISEVMSLEATGLVGTKTGEGLISLAQGILSSIPN